MDLVDLYRNRLSWRRLLLLVERLPADSATARAIHGDDAVWSLQEHLLAAAVDALNIANWQRTQDAVKGRNKPRPIVRPGVHDGTTRYGRGKGMTVEELDKRLGRNIREAADGD